MIPIRVVVEIMMISVRVVVILTAWSAMLAAMLTIMRSRMELYHRSVILMSLPRCQLQRQYVSSSTTLLASKDG